ncbi:hypothetical protein N7450_004460 [Penicillium hetheringtonii]|uniref:rRNA-processing protein EFG1 n=1 Tax=Penicillium hetheringtonii TaxID=911720 RepID=A0AAD6GUF9_9EURO|nr:hypothetical protein N7450_004460 [Penicillium hetheringtonii]
MPLEPRLERSSSKRKGRDGPEDAIAPRKKQHRKPADSDEGDVEMQDISSGDDLPVKSTRKSKGKSTLREEKEYPSVNELKRRIRDVKRLLNKKDLPADARVVQERALAGYEEDLAEETARRERSQMISKYHFVRFLDRKTADKQLKRLLRHDKDDTLDPKKKKSLPSKIHAARVNLNYTIYYPLTEKYISLYPKSKGQSKDDAAADSGAESAAQDKKDEVKSEKPPLWSVVEKCMEEDTLGLLREGKLNLGADGKPLAAPVKKSVSNTENKSKKDVKQDIKKNEKKDEKKVTKNEEESEPKFASRRERRAEKRDQYGQRQHQRGQGNTHHAAAAPDGDESDGGFFE